MEAYLLTLQSECPLKSRRVITATGEMVTVVGYVRRNAGAPKLVLRKDDGAEVFLFPEETRALADLEQRIEEARKRGEKAGENAASWVFDGNTTDETYRRIHQGLLDGDCLVMEQLEWSPLSGEWAGESIEELLGDLIQQSDDTTEEYDDDRDEICEAYEEAARDAYWDAIESTARAHVEG